MTLAIKPSASRPTFDRLVRLGTDHSNDVTVTIHSHGRLLPYLAPRAPHTPRVTPPHGAMHTVAWRRTTMLTSAEMIPGLGCAHPHVPPTSTTVCVVVTSLHALMKPCKRWQVPHVQRMRPPQSHHDSETSWTRHTQEAPLVATCSWHPNCHCLQVDHLASEWGSDWVHASVSSCIVRPHKISPLPRACRSVHPCPCLTPAATCTSCPCT